ncbi:hypothetical protein [Mucisphaera sp.]|uniref:hypothetical protein n=1 Tax=Mucisphaera sp. TaxID=2913024 RepID=UPI003D1374D0
MEETRRLAQRIDELLEREGLPDLEEAAALASQYQQQSLQAQKRLTRCQFLLSANLRTEAVQEADAEPGLLLLIRALELRDFSGWLAFCEQHDLPRPCVFRDDVISEINRAYAAEQRVSPLLREYRFLCAVRAPLTARIAALRALDQHDSDHPGWSKSLVDLEKHRLAEIVDGFASMRDDPETVEAVHRELADERRKVPAPQHLLASVAEALRANRVRQVHEWLEAMLPELGEAYSAMDYEACLGLLSPWQQSLTAVGHGLADLPEPLREAVGPVSAWVEAEASRRAVEAAHREACQSLARAIEADGGVAELHQAMLAVERFELPLPDSLGNDARAELARRVGLQQRQKRMWQRSAALVAVGIVVVIGWVIVREQTEREVERRLDAIERAVLANEPEEARAQWEAFAAGYGRHLDSLRAGEVRVRLDEALEAERERAEAFVREADLLEGSPDDSLTSERLEALSSLARLAEERARYEQLRGRFEAHRLRVEQANDARTLREASALRAELEAAGGLDREASAERVFEVAEGALDQLDAWQLRPGLTVTTERVLGSLRVDAMRLRDLSQAVLDASALERERASMEAGLARYTYRPAVLAGQLTRYAATFPDSPLSPGFTEAAMEAEGWSAVEAWLVLRRQWQGGSDPGSLQMVAERIREIVAYLEAYPSSPMRADLEAYRGYWGAAVLAMSEDGPWLGQLPALLRAPVFRDLNMVETREGKRFYVVGDGGRRDDSAGTRINVILSPDTTQTTAKAFAPGVLGPVVTAPQSELASELLLLVSRLDLGRWHTFPVSVIETVLDADHVDPVLRGVLIEVLLNNLEDGTGRLHPFLAELRDRIAIQGDHAGNWLNPDNVAAQTSRRFMEKVFEEPRDVDRWKAEMDAERVLLHRRISPDVAHRAVLMRDETAAPTALMTLVPASGPFDVWAVVAETETGRGSRLTRVGRFEDQRLELRASMASRLPVGSMLWLTRPAAVADERLTDRRGSASAPSVRVGGGGS